jgi:hypothetical protein
MEMAPGFSYAHRVFGLALELQGKPADAIAEYEKADFVRRRCAQRRHAGASLWDQSAGRTRRQKFSGSLRPASEHRYVDPFWIAIVYVGLNDREHALAELERGYAGRNGDELMLSPDRCLLRSATWRSALREALAEKIMPAREFARAAPKSK